LQTEGRVSRGVERRGKMAEATYAERGRFGSEYVVVERRSGVAGRANPTEGEEHAISPI